MPNSPDLVRASFKIRGGSSSDEFDVHFNPESLQYTITNKMKNTGSGNSAKQYVDESTGKLTMDLVFDTTHSGEDVRLHSVKVAKLMEPKGGSKKTPPIVEFEWGLYTFAGMMESYKETIDFFSADGVPLRASVNLTLASQDDVFEGGSDARSANTAGSMAGDGNNAVQAPPPPDSDGRGVTQTATQAGNPAAARQIAARNGLENMRFPGGAELQIEAGSVSAGVSSLTAGASVNLNAPVSGGLRSSASAGASVKGAFSGLRASASANLGGSLEVDNFLQTSGTAKLGIEDAASFSLGGKAGLQGSASFKADVGAAGALKARIEFDGGE